MSTATIRRRAPIWSALCSKARPYPWLMAPKNSRPVTATAPIIGATRLGHITDALTASQLTLTEEEMRRLEEPYVPHSVLGHS